MLRRSKTSFEKQILITCRNLSLFLNSQSIPGETFVYHYSLFTIYLALRKIKQAFIHANIATFLIPFTAVLLLHP